MRLKIKKKKFFVTRLWTEPLSYKCDLIKDPTIFFEKKNQNNSLRTSRLQLKKGKLPLICVKPLKKIFFCAALYALENEWKKETTSLIKVIAMFVFSSRDE